MNDFTGMNTKKCLICKQGQKNECLHWHRDSDSGSIWVYCVGKCKRGYSIYEYTAKAGLSLREFLKNDFDFEEAKPNEVNRMEWPSWFLPMFDPRAKAGLDYVNGRGLDSTVGDMFYDAEDHGIVFPYYVGSTFVGAQIRFIEPRVDQDGDVQKMNTLPGTRLGLLFYNYVQTPLPDTTRCIVVCEGALNALSIQQALNSIYGTMSNPYRCVATSGCNLTEHHADVLKELRGEGRKIVLAYDFDEAGKKGIRRAIDRQAITHIALTGDDEKDWNDVMQELGNYELAKFFLNGIQKV